MTSRLAIEHDLSRSQYPGVNPKRVDRLERQANAAAGLRKIDKRPVGERVLLQLNSHQPPTPSLNLRPALPLLIGKTTGSRHMRHLTFDLSDSTDGTITLEAMASTQERTRHAEVLAEVDVVLAWANKEFGERKGPVEDGQVWDHELLIQHEADGWITVTLTFSAMPEFADAFLAVFAS